MGKVGKGPVLSIEAVSGKAAGKPERDLWQGGMASHCHGWVGIWEEILPWEGGEGLGWNSQSSWGCLWIPGSVPGQAGQGLELPGTVKGVPCHGNEVSFPFMPNPFHDFGMVPGAGGAAVAPAQRGARGGALRDGLGDAEEHPGLPEGTGICWF